eukprot:scaffold106_cov380-Prasinococcus_capsulatus_cf.AAC.37
MGWFTVVDDATEAVTAGPMAAVDDEGRAVISGGLVLRALRKTSTALAAARRLRRNMDTYRANQLDCAPGSVRLSVLLVPRVRVDEGRGLLEWK